jgi:hypothetical protein
MYLVLFSELQGPDLSGQEMPLPNSGTVISSCNTERVVQHLPSTFMPFESRPLIPERYTPMTQAISTDCQVGLHNTVPRVCTEEAMAALDSIGFTYGDF